MIATFVNRMWPAPYRLVASTVIGGTSIAFSCNRRGERAASVISVDNEKHPDADDVLLRWVADGSLPVGAVRSTR